MASDPDQSDYASIKLTHHVTIGERAEALRRRPGRRSSRPECMVIGHSWTEESHREGGTICIVCQIVRVP